MELFLDWTKHNINMSNYNIEHINQYFNYVLNIEHSSLKLNTTIDMHTVIYTHMSY